MAVRKSGLGKGLDSLIAPNPSRQSGAAGSQPKVIEKVVEKVVEKPVEVKLKISQIEPNREQPRKQFDEAALKELSESIKQYGVLQPLVVQKKDDYYEIIAGERRWRAAKLAGLREVPVIIRDYTEQEIVEIALIENIQRENLNPIEEAVAYKRLMDEFEMKQDEIARRVSKNRSTITNSIRLLKLCPAVQDMVVAGKLSMGHARTLLSLEDAETQTRAAEQIISENLSVRDTEKLVKTLLNPKKQTNKLQLQNENVYLHIAEQMKEAVGSKVTINRRSEHKGRIEIEYYSDAELEHILAVITSGNN